MVIRKLALTAYFLTCPWFAISQANVNANKGNVEDVDAVVAVWRDSCEAFEKDDQLNQENRVFHISCNGRVTEWKTEAGQATLATRGGLHYSFQTKGKFASVGVNQNFPGASQNVQCSVYKKQETRVPDGLGIQFSVRDCNEITKENFVATCEAKANKYCANNFVEDVAKTNLNADLGDDINQGASTDGMCLVSTIAQIDACKGY